MVDGVSFSNYNKPNFDCGKAEDKEIINQGGNVTDLRNKGVQCGGTYINDRYC